jgi:hypothetical protein
VVVARKLSKAERLVDEQMLALLEWAANGPQRWHDLGKPPETKSAAELLAKRGVIEVWLETSRYPLKPKK